LAADGKWGEALDEYLAIMAEAGDVLVPLDPKQPRRAVQARRLVHVRLAALAYRHPATFGQYRRRIETLAARRLREGKQERDAALLQRVVDEAFCSRASEEALDLLGDLAAERGDFDEAQRWWRLLVLPASEARTAKRGNAGKTEILVYPDPNPERVARVRAKQIVVRIFQGERSGLKGEIRAYRALHGEASGELAGRTGIYAEVLARLAADRHLASFQEGEGAWSTFGGQPSRNLVGAKPLAARLGADGPTWSVRLDSGEIVPRSQEQSSRTGKAATPFNHPGSLAFHPLIAGELVLWSDARYVNAHELLTGRRVFRFDLCGNEAANNLATLEDVNLKLPARTNLRYSLTVAGDRLFARLGAQAISPTRRNHRNRAEEGDPRNSWLVCLSLDARARQRLRWSVKARKTDRDPPLFFEGAPLVHGQRVYVAVCQAEPVQTRTWIHCYEADSGRLIWRQEVCETKTPNEMGGDDMRLRHHLLTLAGTHLVYGSHGGAIVALDARTGQRAWAVRYASRGPLTAEGERSPRDLAPCVYAAGRVFAAPLDSHRLLCLDAESGRSLWERDGIEAVHLLGVAEGRLVFTTPTGIRAVSASNGTEADRQGWLQPEDGSKLPPCGRGFLAGGWVYWPTVDMEGPLRALTVASGSPVGDDELLDPYRYRRIAPGNMVYAHGCLAVAGTEILHVYLPEKRFLSQRRAEAGRQGAHPAVLYRLALAEADAEESAAALTHFAGVEKTGLGVKYQGHPLDGLARQGRQEVLLLLGRGRQTHKEWDEAAHYYRQAAVREFSSAGRLLALRRLAEMWMEADQPQAACETWQTILDDPALARGQINSPNGTPEQAGAFAAQRLREIIARHNKAVYEAVEAMARDLLASAPGGREVQVLKQLTEQYPNATVAPSALLRLGRLYDRAKKPALAARAYRQFLSGVAVPAPALVELAVAQAGLARAYEMECRWSRARQAWKQLAAIGRGQIIAAIDPDRPVAEFVALQIRKPEYRLVDEQPRPRWQLPLRRRWSRPADFEDGEVRLAQQLLVVQGNFAHADDPLFVLSGTESNPALHCLAQATGELCWKTTTIPRPSWAAWHGGAILVAGRRAVQSYCRTDGSLLWEFPAPMPALVENSGRADFDLSEFRLAGSMLLCLQGGRRLFALDADSGQVVWARRAPGGSVRPLYPGGRFNPSFHAGAERLVVQIGTGELMLLDRRSGRLVREAIGSNHAWLHAPVRVGKDCLGLMQDARHVVCYNSVTGKEAWIHQTFERTDTTLLTGEVPRLLGNEKVLLAIVPRNYGNQLVRLDSVTGAQLWSHTTDIRPEALDPGRASLDESAVYYANGYADQNVLCARSLKDGQQVWAKSLPSTGRSWRTVCVGAWVLAYPSSLIHLPKGLVFPVQIHDRKDGTLVQRLNLPAPTAEVAVQVLANGLVIEAGGRVWALGGAP
jgi:outer membrane protein assembly factor BamB